MVSTSISNILFKILFHFLCSRCTHNGHPQIAHFLKLKMHSCFTRGGGEYYNWQRIQFVQITHNYFLKILCLLFYQGFHNIRTIVEISRSLIAQCIKLYTKCNPQNLELPAS